MAFRTAMHHTGAVALSQLLQFAERAPEHRSIACPCGQQARYRELRSRRILAVLGEAELTRSWYLCPHCHNGQFPVDRELDIENRDYSPGVRRMQALVGQESPFDHGSEQMRILVGLEVSAKSVERTAEAIGQDVARREQREIQQAVQLDLPVVAGGSDSHPIHPNGRNGRPGGEEGDHGPARQERGPACPYSRSETGMCVHSNHVG